MAEATQYAFELKELTKNLIKLQGIKEGKWVIGFEFGLGAGIIGYNEETARPSAVVAINKIILTRQDESSSVPSFAVDAAEIS